MNEKEFEAAFSSDPLQFDGYQVSSDFVLQQIDLFFHENRSVILVDLTALENQPIPATSDLNLDAVQAEQIAIPAPVTNASDAAATPGKQTKKLKVIQKSKKLPTVPVDPFGDRAKTVNDLAPVPKKYVEKDANYVIAPSQLPEERQKVIDNNLLEVFNFYCRKFAAVRGDFTQKN